MSELKIDPEIPNLKEEVKRVLAEKVEVENFDLYISIGFKHQQFFSNQLCSQIEEILHELESSSEPDDDSDEEGSRRRRRRISLSSSVSDSRNLPLIRLKVSRKT